LWKRSPKKILQFRECHLQVESGLQCVAGQIAQAALGVEHAQDRNASSLVALLRERFELGGYRYETLLKGLRLPARGLDARGGGVDVVLHGSANRVALSAKLRRRGD